MGKQGLYTYSGLEKSIEICWRGGQTETAGPGPLNGAAQMYRKPWEGLQKWESGACTLIRGCKMHRNPLEGWRKWDSGACTFIRATKMHRNPWEGLPTMGKQCLYSYSGLQKWSEIRGSGGKNMKTRPVHLFGLQECIENRGRGGQNGTAGPGPLNGVPKNVSKSVGEMAKIGKQGLYIYSGYKNASKSVGGVAKIERRGLYTYSGLQECFEIRGRGSKNGKAGPGRLFGAAKMHPNPWEG